MSISSVPVHARVASSRESEAPLDLPPRRPSGLLRFTCFALFFFPSSMIIEPIGAAGTVPILLALVLLLFWVASSFWGLHDPLVQSSPMRLAVGVFAIGVLISYIGLYGGWGGDATAKGLAAADRWVIFVFASIGLVLTVSDAVRSVADALAVARWIIAGAVFSCIVGVIQFVAQINPMEWIQAAMPGFDYNGGDTAFQQRGVLVRVAGSTFHSIEFAVTSVMILPLAIWRAMFDHRGSRAVHWLQVVVLAFAIVGTVSRSGTLAAAVALAILLPFLPRIARSWVLSVLPFVVLTLFMVVPGFIGTIGGALTADTSDPSIATRVNNYPRVERLIALNPLVGTGPGTYLPQNALEILDNQYLNAAVSMGLVGLLAVAFYLVTPGIAMLYAARKVQEPSVRCLGGAVAGGLLVAAVCSATFDSFSFPIFALLFPILVGFAGGIWSFLARDLPLEPVPSRPRPSIRRV